MGSPDAYDKSAGTLPSPGVAELMVWTMLLGILRVLASAARRAANIVLLADVARVHRTQLQKLGLDLFNSLLDVFQVHADSLLKLPAAVNKKMQKNAFFLHYALLGF